MLALYVINPIEWLDNHAPGFEQLRGARSVERDAMSQVHRGSSLQVEPVRQANAVRLAGTFQLESTLKECGTSRLGSK